MKCKNCGKQIYEHLKVKREIFTIQFPNGHNVFLYLCPNTKNEIYFEVDFD